MHHERIHPHQLHKHEVASKAGVQFGVYHGVAAKLDDHGAAGEAPNVRQGFGQYARDVQRRAWGQRHAGMAKYRCWRSFKIILS